MRRCAFPCRFADSPVSPIRRFAEGEGRCAFGTSGERGEGRNRRRAHHLRLRRIGERGEGHVTFASFALRLIRRRRRAKEALCLPVPIRRFAFAGFSDSPPAKEANAKPAKEAKGTSPWPHSPKAKGESAKGERGESPYAVVSRPPRQCVSLPMLTGAVATPVKTDRVYPGGEGTTV